MKNIFKLDNSLLIVINVIKSKNSKLFQLFNSISKT